MPLVKKVQKENFSLIVWKIEEDQEFFLSKLVLSLQENLEFQSIKPRNRKLEWLATRYAQRILVMDSIYKDDFGKPFLNHIKGHLSLSHCSGYSAVIYGEKPVGIDIEKIHPKIERIASKFLSLKEMAFIDKQFPLKHLSFCWSIKESVYKYHGRRNLGFIEGIQIEEFKLADLSAKVKLLSSENSELLELQMESFEDIVLTYISG